MNSVQIKVAEQIATCAPTVEGKVVDALASREITRRSDALVKALDQLAKLEQEVKKLKPDQISYNEAGEKVSETFSKGKLEERTKLNDTVVKYTKAVSKALENSDFGDVYNLVNKNEG